MKNNLLLITLFFFKVLLSHAQSGIEWQKSLGGTLGDEATSIKQTRDSGYIVTGYSYSNNGDVYVINVYRQPQLDADPDLIKRNTIR